MTRALGKEDPSNESQESHSILCAPKPQALSTQKFQKVKDLAGPLLDYLSFHPQPGPLQIPAQVLLPLWEEPAGSRETMPGPSQQPFLESIPRLTSFQCQGAWTTLSGCLTQADTAILSQPQRDT